MDKFDLLYLPSMKSATFTVELNGFSVNRYITCRMETLGITVAQKSKVVMVLLGCGILGKFAMIMHQLDLHVH